jgi:hypothetical protein
MQEYSTLAELYQPTGEEEDTHLPYHSVDRAVYIQLYLR